MKREHRGCGMRNPFLMWIWVTLALAQFISWSVIALLWGSYLASLGFLGYVPWLAAVAASIHWERVHSPEQMYRTWWP